MQEWLFLVFAVAIGTAIGIQLFNNPGGTLLVAGIVAAIAVAGWVVWHVGWFGLELIQNVEPDSHPWIALLIGLIMTAMGAWKTWELPRPPPPPPSPPLPRKPPLPESAVRLKLPPPPPARKSPPPLPRKRPVSR